MVRSLTLKWPEIDAPYLDQFGRIDVDIYQEAGEIWRKPPAFLQYIALDESSFQRALLKVCAYITARRATGAIQIENLKAYLVKSFKRELLAELRSNRLVGMEQLDRLAIENESIQHVENKILLEQVLALMDPWCLELYQLQTVGYSFEEIAKIKGVRSNFLRSKYSKQLQKIKRQLGIL